MKDQFLNLKNQAEEMPQGKLHEAVSVLVDEIIGTDERLLSVSKSWSGYGTWKSSSFANEYYFGDELSGILTKAMNGSVTHDEDRVFTVEDFRDRITDEVFEAVYHA